MSGTSLRVDDQVRNTELRDVAEALRTVRRLAHFMRRQDRAARSIVALELRNVRAEVLHG